MAGTTSHYGLSTMGSGDSFQGDGYKHIGADRQTIDSLLHLGAEGHQHTGASGAITEPEDPPDLTLETTGGTIPSGTRVYYKYSLVNERDEESVPGPEGYVDTPSAIVAPSAPVISYATAGGALQGGNYFYSLSAYAGSSIGETRALHSSQKTIPPTTITNLVTLTLPELPAGADGFNIYRRKPGQAKAFFLDSVDMQVATPPTEYEDDGSVSEDCDRSVPRENNTNSTNSITIEIPDGVVPTGYTWRIYRTYIPNVWTSSFLTHVVEYVDEATPTITGEFLDVGRSTLNQAPPETSLIVGSPSKILLTDMAEVQGTLPMSSTPSVFPLMFQFPGAVTVMEGATAWVCPFPQAEIVWVKANLGRGSHPASTAVIVDVNYSVEEATPTYATIFTNQANRPTVPVGAQVGVAQTPDVTLIGRGDIITCDIDQAGGGATPTDSDLVVTVYMVVYGFPTTSYVTGSTGGAGGDF